LPQDPLPPRSNVINNRKGGSAQAGPSNQVRTFPPCHDAREPPRPALLENNKTLEFYAKEK
jgi:hypothetical protein